MEEKAQAQFQCAALSKTVANKDCNREGYDKTKAVREAMLESP